MSITSSLWRFFATASLPRVAAGFINNQVVLLSLNRRRGRYHIDRVAHTSLPKTLLNPDFSSTNIAEVGSLATLIKQATERAGLKWQTRWSVALPEATVRSLIVNLETKPTDKDELTNMLSWKVERIVGVPTSRLQVVQQKIGGGNNQRYLVTVVEKAVLNEYEAVFQRLGWHVGFIAPRHIGEANWLTHLNVPGDKMLVSYNESGFVAVVMRGTDPLVIRSHNCLLDERDNELYRLATYYREKLRPEVNVPLTVLVLGDDAERQLTEATFNDALQDRSFRFINTKDLGLDIGDPQLSFSDVASVAGLAALAYN